MMNQTGKGGLGYVLGNPTFSLALLRRQHTGHTPPKFWLFLDNYYTLLLLNILKTLCENQHLVWPIGSVTRLDVIPPNNEISATNCLNWSHGKQRHPVVLEGTDSV